MSRIAFMPGFDGDVSLRHEFMEALSEAGHEVRGISYPARVLGSLAAYRDHAASQVPADWKPVLVAESFSGLVAATWAAADPRVRALVLCGAFARNPGGPATALGALAPALVKWAPSWAAPWASFSGDPARGAWARGFSRALAALRDDVVAERLRLIAAEDTGPLLGALRVPVLLVQFQRDQVVGRAARDHLEAVCHNARVLRIAGPHFAIETRPRECAKAIDRELATLLDART